MVLCASSIKEPFRYVDANVYTSVYMHILQLICTHTHAYACVHCRQMRMHAYIWMYTRTHAYTMHKHAYTMHTQCIHVDTYVHTNAYTMHTQCIHNAYTMHTQCMRTVSCLYSPRITTRAQIAYEIRSERGHWRRACS